MNLPSVLRGGEFLIKESEAQSVFIPEEISEEQKLIVDSCQKFLESEVLPNLDRIDNKEEGLMVSIINKAAELGLLGTAIPEEFGGLAWDFNSNTLFTEVIGAGHSFPVSLLAHTGIGTLPILYFGNDEQRKKYLPKLATGTFKACYCLTEPGSGSDALAAKTKAVLSSDKKHYLLNGQKMWITNAGFADIFIVFAQIDGDKFTGFIVEKTTQGLTLGQEEHKMGIKGSSTRQVFFNECRVPVENVLGEIGKGHLIAFNILNIGRIKLGAATLGAAKSACNLSVRYTLEREQFKTPISQFGAIQHKLAEQAIRIYACESALYRTSDYIDKKEKELLKSGENYSSALLGAAKEFAIECAMIKVFGSEVLDYVVDEGVQIYGGMGFSEDAPMARSYRDSRINRIFEGTNEINRLLTVDMLIKKAMKGELDLLNAAKTVQKELMGIPEISYEEERLFSKEKKTIVNLKKTVLVVAGAAVQKLMMQLQHEQEILMNIADMLMETFVCESLLLRIEKLTSIRGERETSLHRDILHVYFNDSIERIAISAKHAVTSFAEGDELRMLLLGVKRFTNFEPLNTKTGRRRIVEKMILEKKYCF